jgi:hypothetical protein
LFVHFALLGGVGQVGSEWIGAICSHDGGATIPQSPVNPAPGCIDGLCCVFRCAAATGNTAADAHAIARYGFVRSDDVGNGLESGIRTPRERQIRPLGSRAPPAMTV